MNAHTVDRAAGASSPPDMPGLPFGRCELPGFWVDPGTLDDYLELIRTAVRSRTSHTILYHNLHSLYLYFTLPDLPGHYASHTVLVDGMPLIGLLKLHGIPATRRHRLTYMDFIHPLMALARDNRWRVFHVGQHESVQRTALQRLRDATPGLLIDGHHGYFERSPNGTESQRVVNEINGYEPAIVLVGLGTPAQETWLAAWRERIDAPIVLTCGACMEYVAGAVATPPRWLGPLGLEWTARLAGNPRRFAFRYLAEPVFVAYHLLRRHLCATLHTRPTD